MKLKSINDTRKQLAIVRERDSERTIALLNEKDGNIAQGQTVTVDSRATEIVNNSTAAHKIQCPRDETNGNEIYNRAIVNKFKVSQNQNRGTKRQCTGMDVVPALKNKYIPSIRIKDEKIMKNQTVLELKREVAAKDNSMLKVNSRQIKINPKSLTTLEDIFMKIYVFNPPKPKADTQPERKVHQARDELEVILTDEPIIIIGDLNLKTRILHHSRHAGLGNVNKKALNDGFCSLKNSGAPSRPASQDEKTIDSLTEAAIDNKATIAAENRGTEKTTPFQQLDLTSKDEIRITLSRFINKKGPGPDRIKEDALNLH
ncbi:hypothetical protein EVAR_12624_1 [Eumeta japonica]|uniref:Endonuclease/exonuclease/phosphatase domain-containing protein n=1 Tax=Eumeta variegata TaxID=151549 RepID=A0A4C1UFR3_EUMVA|nr:hypothetical protein EVAR_12624_1 [Eumeta japonica]